MTDKCFQHAVRVYFEDTDAGGIVYHARYLGFMERARGEMLREMGFEQTVMMKQKAPLIVVSKLEINYRRPAHLDDLLIVKTRILNIRAASVTIQQTIEREGETITTAQLRCASIDPIRGVPVPFYEPMYKAFCEYVSDAD